jgi:hypothetical protein
VGFVLPAILFFAFLKYGKNCWRVAVKKRLAEDAF